MSARLTGFLLALTGLVILSPDAGLTRFIHMETWSLIFWRGIGLFGTVGFLALIFYRQKLLSYFQGLTWHAWAIIPLYGTVPLMWILGVRYAGGGQVLAVLAIAPLVASFSSRLFLGEAIRPATLIASLVAMLGVLVIVAEAFFHPAPDVAARHPLYLIGVVCSLAIPVFYALVMTFSRKVDRPNSWPMISLSGLVMVLAGLVVAPEITWPAEREQAWAVLWLVFIVGSLSTGFLTLATRYTTSADVTMVVMMEPVLGVGFLWMLVQETPTAFQWSGGAIVFTTVLVYTVQQLARRETS